jgi:ribosomal protein S18 acetylase RimI-like enzyme
MHFTYRFGEPDDTTAIRDYVLDAGGGLFEYMLDRAIPGVKARHLVHLAVAEPGSVLCYDNAIVAEAPDGHIAGIALAYPAAEFGLSTVLETVVPSSRLQTLRDMLSRRVERTLYLNTLAVADWARGQSLGSTLLDLTTTWAQERGFSGVSLHVWEDNQNACKLYQSRGFETVHGFDLPGVRRDAETEAGERMLLLKVPVEPEPADTPRDRVGAADEPGPHRFS